MSEEKELIPILVPAEEPLMDLLIENGYPEVAALMQNRMERSGFVQVSPDFPTTYTAQDAIHAEAIELNRESLKDSEVELPEYISPEEVDSLLMDLEESVEGWDSWLYETLNYDIRSGSYDTNLPCEYSRHYESKYVVYQLESGHWVGWVYWHGGGKHGEPEAIDWLSDAEFIKVEEKPVLSYERKFYKQSMISETDETGK